MNNILFLDIETVPLYSSYSEVPPQAQELWEEKTRYIRGETLAEDYYPRAGIWAEFGKIVCISVGYLRFADGRRQFRLRSFTGEEREILEAFSELLEQHFSGPHHLLAAHNGKEFDFPFIARRLLVQGLPIPKMLQYYGKKPWEVPHLDTLELWKFGDYKHYTSLKLLAYTLGIPSPKEDIDGSEVMYVYYELHDIERIRKYCERDTLTVAQILLRMKGEPLLTEKEIFITS